MGQIRRAGYDRRRMMWEVLENRLPDDLTPAERAILVLFYAPASPMTDGEIGYLLKRKRPSVTITRKRLIKALTKNTLPNAICTIEGY